MMQMPEESRRFKIVDKTWRDVMHEAVDDPTVFKVIEIEALLAKMQKCNNLLELILKVSFCLILRERVKINFDRILHIDSHQSYQIINFKVARIFKILQDNIFVLKS